MASGMSRAPAPKPFVVVSLDERRDSHLPGPLYVVAFTYAGHCALADGTRLPAVSMCGLHDHLRHHVHSADHAAVILPLRPDQAYALLRQPLDLLRNRTLGLSDLLPNPVDWSPLLARLAAASGLPERLPLAREALAPWMANAPPDPLISQALDLLLQAGGQYRVDDLAQQLGLSQSALERRFRQRVGMTPRRYASLIRLSHAARLREAGHDLTSVAHASGYFDQSHLVRDLRRTTGVPPSAGLSPLPEQDAEKVQVQREPED
jgi:AraC-like DNA-binding protein